MVIIKSKAMCNQAIFILIKMFLYKLDFTDKSLISL